jgi:hypothetical protein
MGSGTTWLVSAPVRLTSLTSSRLMSRAPSSASLTLAPKFRTVWVIPVTSL